MTRWLLLITILAAGCGRAKVRVGSKGFAEQRLLAEMTRQLLLDKGVPVDPVVVTADTYTSQGMMRAGRIDVMVEYTGTGLYFLGEPVPRGEPLELLRKQYAKLGLEWLGPLGFDNGYRVFVTPAKAERHGLKAIGDLSKLPGGPRVSCPPAYVRRPGDGLNALFDRYGLGEPANTLVIDNAQARTQALLDGRCDAMVGFSTDGTVVGLGLVALDDDKQFFPPYDAVVVARSAALEDHGDAIRSAAAELAAALDPATMRDLNRAIQVNGRKPAEVARSFLVKRGLLKKSQAKGVAGLEMAVVYDSADRLGGLVEKAGDAVRGTFPERSVDVAADANPVKLVTTGRARLALLGGERFFEPRPGRPPRRVRGLQAAAVVGTRRVHLLKRADDEREPPFVGKVGVGPAGTGGGLIGTRVLAAGEATPTLRGPDKALIDALLGKKIDRALLVFSGESAPETFARVKALIGEKKVALVSLDGWMTPARNDVLPFLRPTRLPKKDYGSVVDTLGSQVVLACAARGGGPSAAGSPATALADTGVPLTRDEVLALADQAGVMEAPDPALPSALAGTGYDDEADSTLGSLVKTAFNVLAVLFLVWLVRAVLAAAPREAADGSDRPAG